MYDTARAERLTASLMMTIDNAPKLRAAVAVALAEIDDAQYPSDEDAGRHLQQDVLPDESADDALESVDDMHGALIRWAWDCIDWPELYRRYRGRAQAEARSAAAVVAAYDAYRRADAAYDDVLTARTAHEEAEQRLSEYRRSKNTDTGALSLMERRRDEARAAMVEAIDHHTHCRKLAAEYESSRESARIAACQAGSTTNRND